MSSSPLRDARPKPSVHLSIDRSDTTPQSFSPLLPPRKLSWKLEDFKTQFIEWFDAHGTSELHKGLYAWPLFKDLPLSVHIPDQAKAEWHLSIDKSSLHPHQPPKVNALQINFKPFVRIDRILAILLRLPTLFQDRRLAFIKHWSKPDQYRLVHTLLSALGEAGQKVQALLQKSQANLKDMISVELHEISAYPVWKAKTWRLELRFSGRILLLHQHPIPFHHIHLPVSIIPSPHAWIHKLLSPHPLATAEIIADHWSLPELLQPTLNLLKSSKIDVHAGFYPPKLFVQALLPDQSVLKSHWSTDELCKVQGDWMLEHRKDGLDIHLLHHQLQWNDRAQLSFDAHASLRSTHPHMPFSQLMAQYLSHPNAQKPCHILVETSLNIYPKSSLPQLKGQVQISHRLLKGHLDLHLLLEHLRLDGHAGAMCHANLSKFVPQLELDLDGLLSVLPQSEFKGAKHGFAFEAPQSQFNAHLSLTSAQILLLQLQSSMHFASWGTLRIDDFPELNVQSGLAKFNASGYLSLDHHLKVKPLYSWVLFDASDSRVDLKFESLEWVHDQIRFQSPPQAWFNIWAQESAILSNGHGHSLIHIQWDFWGNSPLLSKSEFFVELLVHSLRQGLVSIHIDENGGISISGAEGDLYDGHFFNALVNPAAEPEKILQLIRNPEAVDRIVQAFSIFVPQAKNWSAIIHALIRRVQSALEAEEIHRVGDLIPREKLAAFFSRLLVNQTSLVPRLEPLIAQVTDGLGLDVFGVRRILDEVWGDHPWIWELDRTIRWLAKLLAPTEPIAPPTPIRALAYDLTPELLEPLKDLPTARDLEEIALENPVQPHRAALLVRVAPYLNLEQLQSYWDMGIQEHQWPPALFHRLQYIRELKTRISHIAQAYGGLAFAPQSAIIALFLGESLAMSRAAQSLQTPELPLARGLLGPHDIAVLVQASLASPIKGRTHQHNQRLIIDYIDSQPPSFLREICVEVSGKNPRVLASFLNAWLNMEQQTWKEPLDLVQRFSERLGVKLPLLEDYLAGGKWANLSYYEALNHAAVQILKQADLYLALRARLQLFRHPAPIPKPMDQGLQTKVQNAQKAIQEADRFAQTHPELKDQIAEAYEQAFEACRVLRRHEPLAFQWPWFKTFWLRNYNALMVHSVYQNLIDEIDRVPHWFEYMWGAPASSIQDDPSLVHAIVDVLFAYDRDRKVLKEDPLVQALLPGPKGHYDLTVISAMGVVTEGAQGRELEAAYKRLEAQYGVQVIRANTATARSLEFNAERIIEAAWKAPTRDWAWIGYSQGCANAMMAEAFLMSGSPKERDLAQRLVARNLLFSAFNGSPHGSAGDLKFLKAMIDGERFLKHYQAILSKPAIQFALKTLRQTLDSRLFVTSLLSTQSLSREGVITLHRQGQFRYDVPTTTLRGEVEPKTLPEALEWLAHVLNYQIGHQRHDTQVVVEEAVGHSLWVQNAWTEWLKRCDMGSTVQRTHHWAPLVAAAEMVTTLRDRKHAIYDSPKDRQVFPWLEVNARFGSFEIYPTKDESQ